MPLPESALRASLALQTDEVFLECLRITHSGLAAPVCIVRNNEAITRADGVYQPWGFSVTYPENGEDTSRSGSIDIDNVDRAVSDLLRGLDMRERPKASIFSIMASAPDVIVEGPYQIEIAQASYMLETMSLSLGDDGDPMQKQVPAIKFQPSNYAGLF